MKKRLFFSLLIILLLATANVSAQIHGLSVTDLATPVGKGVFEVMATTSHSDDLRLYGGRLGYGITENFLLFTDMGLLQDDQLNSEDFLAQFGLKYTLPFNLPFDLAMRTTFIPYKADTEHYVEITFGFLASKYLDAASKWAIYSGVGVDYQDIELIRPLPAEYGGGTYIYDEALTDASFTFGLRSKLNESSSLFVEAVHVDHLFFGAGIKFERK